LACIWILNVGCYWQCIDIIDKNLSQYITNK
jgi:hypothetical protein